MQEQREASGFFGCLEEDGKHAAMSMTKSFTGLLAERVTSSYATPRHATTRHDTRMNET